MTDLLKRIKHTIVKRHVYGWTSPLRTLPDFMVIGAVRSGTTSLYHYLDQHPSIVKSAYDELGYFDSNYELGINWYKSLFPTIFQKRKLEKKTGKFKTYDVTPFYIYNDKVPKRIYRILPKIKLIAVLRNPVDRSYSNYFLGSQKKRFEVIIENEKKIIENIDRNNKEVYYKFVHSSILARGFYAEQLERWYEVFPKEQILIIKSEELASETNKVMNKIFHFLGLDDCNIHDSSKKNKIVYEPMRKETRLNLTEYFRPYNKKLYSLTGIDFGWES